MTTMTTKKRITEDEYVTHDCHASPEDGCQTCEDYQNQIDEDNKKIDESLKHTDHIFSPNDSCFHCVEEYRRYKVINPRGNWYTFCETKDPDVGYENEGNR